MDDQELDYGVCLLLSCLDGRLRSALVRFGIRHSPPSHRMLNEDRTMAVRCPRDLVGPHLTIPRAWLSLKEG